MEDNRFNVNRFKFQTKQLLGFLQKLEFFLLIHASLSLMTFLPSEADGFQFQTTLIKRKHRNKAGLYRVFCRAAPVILGKNKSSSRQQNVTNPAAE